MTYNTLTVKDAGIVTTSDAHYASQINMYSAYTELQHANNFLHCSLSNTKAALASKADHGNGSRIYPCWVANFCCKCMPML